MAYVSTAPTIEALYNHCMKWTTEPYTPPNLTIISLTDDPATASYVRSKMKAAEKWKINAEHKHLPGISAEELRKTIYNIGIYEEPRKGIIIQRPLPPNIKEEYADIPGSMLTCDVDGLHPYSPYIPATALGVFHFVMEYLHNHYKTEEEIRSKRVTILGRSKLVGEPLAKLFIQRGLTVTSCNSLTPNYKYYTDLADVIVSATGKTTLTYSDCVPNNMNPNKKLIVDVGIRRIDGKLRGDILLDQEPEDFDITPVPGGVGPLTVAFLMYNCHGLTWDQFRPEEYKYVYP